jgi:hypothetical protein
MKLISEYVENDLQCIVEKKEDGARSLSLRRHVRAYSLKQIKRIVTDVSTPKPSWNGQ